MTAPRPLVVLRGGGQVTSVDWADSTSNVSDVPIDLGQDAFLMSTVNAVLPTLPAPLVLRHGPLLVTVETWSDQSVVARLPCAALTGEGDFDTAALDDLATTIADFCSTMLRLERQEERIAGPLKKDWDSIQALVDVPRVVG